MIVYQLTRKEKEFQWFNEAKNTVHRHLKGNELVKTNSLEGCSQYGKLNNSSSKAT